MSATAAGHTPDIVKRLSDALLKVRPLGGSEMFIRHGDGFVADPDFCARCAGRKSPHREQFGAHIAASGPGAAGPDKLDQRMRRDRSG